MRIPNKVVCLWSCLTAFTFIHTAVAQDYSAEPLSGAGVAGGLASADYAGSTMLGDAGIDADYGQEYAPTGYDDGTYADPGAQGFYPPAPAGYPPPMVQPNMNYWPQVSPYETPVMERNYRQNGIWVNDSIYGDRTYSMNLEYMRVGFNRPGTDLVGARGVGAPANLSGFHPVNTGVFANGDDLLSDGIRSKFIMQNADSSSLEIGGFWVGESSAVYQPYAPGVIGRTSTVRVRGILGLDNGTGGIAVPYDTDFQLGYKSQAFGADLTWATTPFFESSGFKLRPVFGAKYLKIREEFTFHGQDSGLSFAYNPRTGLPIAGTPFVQVIAPYSSDLLSRVKSNLGGPEVGIRYEVGGSHFLLSGQSRFALLVNRESIELSGNHIGDGFGTGFPTPTPSDPKPSAFYHTRTNTHVSPTFSQDFQFKGKVFRMLPIFNDIALFANADMLVGYNFTLVGNVARPTKIIDWKIDNPQIDLNHSRWYMQAVTWGMQWQF